jgi:hypothetical protein
MLSELSSEKVLTDSVSGQRFVYVGAGKSPARPDAIIAYSPTDVNGRVVAFADGSVAQMSSEQFAAALQRDASVDTSAGVPLAVQQFDAVRQQQERTAPAVDEPAVLPQRSISGQVAGEKLDRLHDAKKPEDAMERAAGAFQLPADGRRNRAVNGDWFGGVLGQAVPGGPPASPAARPPLEGGAGGAAPTESGLRSIRIDIPRSGRAFTFTKVLNVSDEPLSVKMSVMKLSAFQAWRSALQLLAFLGGLLVVWREWHRVPRRSLALTLGVALAGGSVASLLIATRSLHLVLLLGFPALVLVLLGWLAWKVWPRKAGQAASPSPSATDTPNPNPNATGPAVASLAFLLGCSVLLSGSASAQVALGSIADSQSPIANRQSPIANAYSLLSATYSGSVGEKVAQFDAVIQVATFATNQVVPLFGDDVAVQEFSTDAKGVRLLRLGNTVVARFEDKAHATLRAKLVAKLGGDVTRRQLAFGIPPALSSQLKMTIAEGEADVEFLTAIAFKRAPDKQETRVEAVLGAGDRVEMFWTPRVKRVADMAASVFAENVALVTVGGGVVNTRATLDYQITQGEVRQLKVRLPAGQRLLRVEGDLIRTWELSDEAKQPLLTVELLKGVSPSYRLVVETERLLDKLPAQVAAEVPHALDVIRETGLIGLRGTEEVSLTVEEARELQRVDAAEFERKAKAEGLVSAHRFLKPSFALGVRAEAVQPQVEAIARNALRIGFEQLTLSAQLDYTIKKAGVFGLKMAVPRGFRIDKVSGEKIAQWTEREEGGLRVLEVSFQERVTGAYPLRVELAQPIRDLPARVEVGGVHPMQVSKLSGFVSVTSEPGVQVKTDTFSGLTEIPPAQLGASGAGVSPAERRQAGLLAFKFIVPDGAWTGAPWLLNVTTEALESWVRAEVVNVLSVSETLVSGRALVRYEIQNAPVKEFRLKVPAGFTNVEVFGADIRRRDRGEEYRVELQNKVRGIYTLSVTWEQPRPAGTNAAIEVAGIEALGAERETGAVVLTAKPPLQVTERAATEQLVKIDVRELPEWAGVSATAGAGGGERPVLVYRYLRPGYRLTAEARRFDEAAVLQALVDSAQLTTVVAEDGQMMTEMSLGIRNNGLQHLAVELPANAMVWSAFVAGQPVRPSRREGKLMLPLERSAADGAPVKVELTYIGAQRFPKSKGRVQLVSPTLDVPLKNARWDVYLPPDYAYAKFEGSMTREAEAAPVVRVYSSLEYSRQEGQKRAARQSEVRSFLRNARKDLSEGKLKGAADDFNQALKLEAAQDEEARNEVESLRRDLSKVQSSNLIQAQREYTVENSARFRGGQDRPQSQAANKEADLLQYDADVAEQQWGALQRAQAVTVAKVQPLRANFPTHGQKLSFSQVLQTEVNKPMTVRFQATNTKELGWFRRAVYAAGGFLMLWIFVTVAASRAGRRAQAQAAA